MNKVDRVKIVEYSYGQALDPVTRVELLRRVGFGSNTFLTIFRADHQKWSFPFYHRGSIVQLIAFLTAILEEWPDEDPKST